MSGRKKCRHCRRHVAWKARGLCGRCFYHEHIRNLYPPGRDCVSTQRGPGWQPGSGREGPPEPTAAEPGTPEKMAELERRAALGLSLWHAGDARRGLE